MRRFSILFFVVLLFSFCKKSGSEGGGAGSGDSAAAAYQTSAQIGAAGGTISDPNGNWTLTIPSGALTENKTITVTTNATAPGSIPDDYTAASSVLRFEPSGLTFLAAATLKVKYPQGEMTEGGIEEKLLKQHYLTSDSKVTPISSSVNMTTNEITAQLSHFSFSASLTNSIRRVNTGATTRPSSVRRVANRVIAHFNSLANDAARNAEYAANKALLDAFVAKLVQILGSDLLTLAFPNADFNNNGIPNSSDPIVSASGPTVTVTTTGSLFVSTNVGAINSTQFTWRSNQSGTYSIRLNGTGCTNGTVLQSGAVTLNVDNNYTPINASALVAGDNEFRICVTAGPHTSFYLLVVTRDEVYPASAASPAGGTYTTSQNVSMTCLDTGDAGCAQIAYTTNGSDPTFDAAGNVTNGTLVTGMWLTPATGATTLKVRARDEAGNVGAVVVELFSGPSPITYTMTYSGNGSTAGDVPVDPTSYVFGADVQILANTGGLTKSGYTFSHWNTQLDDSGTSYFPGMVFQMGAASVTLYAQWKLSRGWRQIAASSDNTKLVAVVYFGRIYTSADGGLTWTPRDSNRPWNAVGSSADGTKLIAAVNGGQIYLSTDSGVNWIPRESNRNWSAVASSADGSKLVACVGNGRIYTSGDSGINWTARESSREWLSVTSSSDGMNLAAAAYGGQIYTSTDSGVTWIPRESDRNWRGITSSSDGTRIVAVVYNYGRIYTSDNGGLSWVARESNRLWYAVASSSDGLKLVAGDLNGQIYTSQDGGTTWTSRESNRNWYFFASSSSGDKLASVVESGLVYISEDAGATWFPRF